MFNACSKESILDAEVLYVNIFVMVASRNYSDNARTIITYVSVFVCHFRFGYNFPSHEETWCLHFFICVSKCMLGIYLYFVHIRTSYLL